MRGAEVPVDPDGNVRARHPGAVGCDWALGRAAPARPGGWLRGGPGVEADLTQEKGGTVSKLRGIHFIQFGARLRQFEEGFTSGIVLGNKITLTCSVLGNLLGFFTFNPCFCCGPSSSNFDFGCAAVAEESGESALGSDH